jgi:hypothetical protein
MSDNKLTDLEALCLFVAIPFDYSDFKSYADLQAESKAHDDRMAKVIPRYDELIALFQKTPLSVSKLKTGLEALNEKGLVEPYFQTHNITPAGLLALAGW